jgi:four helix bundle protein
MDLVETVYTLTKQFPKEEQFGLVSQMRRSAISIPSNISEGAGRFRKKEFSHFLNVALGSLAELETQLLIAQRLGYTGQIQPILEQVSHLFRLIKGLKRYLE